MNQRRDFIKTAMGAVALAAVGRAALASENCSVSPAQTTGPFVPDDFPFRVDPEGRPYIISADSDSDLTRVANGPRAEGQKILLRGQIVDQNCQPVANASVYLWQADVNGHYNHEEDPNINQDPNPARFLDPNFQYRGVVTTNEEGRYEFTTVVPKYYPLDPNQPGFKRTAHMHIGVVANGFKPLFTQAYFEGHQLDEIDEIRRLNKIDILLGQWSGQRPIGQIDPRFLPLIVEYKAVNWRSELVGDLRLSIQR